MSEFNNGATWRIKQVNNIEGKLWPHSTELHVPKPRSLCSLGYKLMVLDQMISELPTWRERFTGPFVDGSKLDTYMQMLQHKQELPF